MWFLWATQDSHCLTQIIHQHFLLHFSLGPFQFFSQVSVHHFHTPAPSFSGLQTSKQARKLSWSFCLPASNGSSWLLLAMHVQKVCFLVINWSHQVRGTESPLVTNERWPSQPGCPGLWVCPITPAGTSKLVPTGCGQLRSKAAFTQGQDEEHKEEKWKHRITVERWNAENLSKERK
jgi:hypothetical protein